MMKKNDLLLLNRFLIISLLYFLYARFLGIGLFLYYPVFIPLLAVYLILIIICFFVPEKINLRIKIASDIFFLIVFLIEISIMTFSILTESDLGEAFIGLLLILTYSPMFICYIVWFIRDKRKFETYTGRTLFKIYELSNRVLYKKFLIRFLTLLILYYILNDLFSFTFLLAPQVFWSIILTYFLVIIVSLFFEEKLVGKILVISDIFFVLIFFSQAIYMLINSFISITSNNEEFSIKKILTISPLVICFLIYLLNDKKYLMLDKKSYNTMNSNEE